MRCLLHPRVSFLPVISRIKGDRRLEYRRTSNPSGWPDQNDHRGEEPLICVFQPYPLNLESVVLRVLDKSAVNLILRVLVLPKASRKASGMRFVGPTEFLSLPARPVRAKPPPCTSLERGEPNGHQVTDCGGSGGIRD